MNVNLIAYTAPITNHSPETFIEYCGRVCYASDSKLGQASNWLQHRLSSGHESIIEHASLTFEIDGISRACSHQLVRHRLASYSQESQRYVKIDDLQNNAVYPDSILSSNCREDVEEFLQETQNLYAKLVTHGIPAEDARFILPNATQTRIIVTMNLRELRHFLKLRLSKHAQWEIRAVAKAILNIAYDYCPVIFQDFMEALENE